MFGTYTVRNLQVEDTSELSTGWVDQWLGGLIIFVLVGCVGFKSMKWTHGQLWGTKPIYPTEHGLCNRNTLKYLHHDFNQFVHVYYN